MLKTPFDEVIKIKDYFKYKFGYDLELLMTVGILASPLLVGLLVGYLIWG